MIIQCQGCTAKYFLSEDKVPKKPIRVRCPKCGAVFRLELRSRNENIIAGKSPSVVSSAQSSGEKQAGVSEKTTGTSVKEKPVHSTRRQRRESKDSRARRLARVLVSDILWYNKGKRDQALIDGNLMTVLGEEIKKSWELYKDKIGSEMASSTNYFKEALNEILADGQKIF